jgi:mRNA-degrading endonuclease toxin of MazEF toxin-antitoxin module
VVRRYAKARGAQLSLRRGDLVFGLLELTDTDEMVRKRFVVVSTDAINELGMFPILARISENHRDRRAPTAVEVEPDRENHLPSTSHVLCHDLVTLPSGQLGDSFGRLSVVDLFRVEAGLRYSLYLDA